MNEADLYPQYILAATAAGARLFRNNNGLFRALHTEQKVRCGLGHHSGDLIGWIPIDGRAVFLSVEVKVPGRKTSKATREGQEAWRSAIDRAGGVGLKCFSVEEMEEELRCRIDSTQTDQGNRGGTQK